MVTKVSEQTGSHQEVGERLRQVQEELMLAYARRLLESGPNSQSPNPQVPERNLRELVNLYVHTNQYPPLSKLDPTSPKDRVHFVVHQAAAAVLPLKQRI